MRLNAASLDIRDATISTPGTLNDLTTDLIMANNNNNIITIQETKLTRKAKTPKHYKTADTDIQHCIQYITNIPHSVLTGDVNAHSTLWHSYTYDHRGQLIADVISNSDHITLNTNTPTRVPNTTLQQASSPRFLTHFTTGHCGQLNTHYHQTTYP